MLRCIYCGFCQEVCPEEAIFLQKRLFARRHERGEMIYNKEKLLALSASAPASEMETKTAEAQAQENFRGSPDQKWNHQHLVAVAMCRTFYFTSSRR